MTRRAKQRSIRQLTLRGLGPDLAYLIRELAEHEDISLTQAVIRLLRRGAGLATDDAIEPIGNRLDRFIGRWSSAEANEFEESTKVFARVDAFFRE